MSLAVSKNCTHADTHEYNCITGYSLDGKFDGEIAFFVECQADGETTKPKTCKPVECGEVKSVEHATVDATSLVFEEEATYTCTEGYTVTGSHVGSNEFVVSCEPSGAITAAGEETKTARRPSERGGG